MKLLPGVTAGHWTDPDGMTGTTVVILPPGNVASGEIRGGAPATREFGLLAPGMLVSTVDALVMTGGSAFGLGSAQGAMDWLAGLDRGFETAHGKVPIVVAMALYDLAVGDAMARPGPDAARRACQAATEQLETGRVGCGTGATYRKYEGPDRRLPGGLVAAEVSGGEPVVSVQSIVAVNSFGGMASPRPPRVVFDPGAGQDLAKGLEPGANTTLVTVLTDAALDKVACHLVAQGGHDGIARALDPVHTRYDGDAVVAVATGSVPADVDLVRSLAVAATELAIRSLEPVP